MPYTKYFAHLNLFIQHNEATKKSLFLLSVCTELRTRDGEVTFTLRQPDSRAHCLCAMECAVSPPGLWAEVPTPSVTVFGARTFRRELSLNGFIRVGS